MNVAKETYCNTQTEETYYYTTATTATTLLLLLIYYCYYFTTTTVIRRPKRPTTDIVQTKFVSRRSLRWCDIWHKMMWHMTQIVPVMVDRDGELAKGKGPMNVAKETSNACKRALWMWQKRPNTQAKEPYECGKRDLIRRQKSPMNVAKET